MQSEGIIYDAFSSEEFVEKLVTFLSMEEVKGQDRFDIHKYLLFKVCYNAAVSLETLSDPIVLFVF